MSDNIGEADWVDILEKFSAYEGTIASFCKKHKINHHKLYYQRKKVAREKTSFYPISLPTEALKPPNEQKSKIDTPLMSVKDVPIMVEIGKAKVYIPTHDITVLSHMLKQLVKLC